MKTDLNSLFFVSSISSVVLAILFLRWFQKRRSSQILLKDPNIKYTVKLIEKKKVSWDTRRFRFGLPSEEYALGLPTGQHIYLTARIKDRLVIRPYTPVTSDDNKGYFDLVVKIYFKNQHPNFPEGGKMSQYLESLQIGDEIQIRGPSGNLIYNSNGNFSIKQAKNSPSINLNFKKLGMIAGGTGITPMLQIIRHVLKNANDKTQIWLIFANQNEKNIILKEELDEATKNHSDRLSIWYTIDTAENSDWPYSTGFVNSEMIENHFPPPGDDTLVLMCGPPGMIKYACTPNLDNLGYTKSLRFTF